MQRNVMILAGANVPAIGAMFEEQGWNIVNDINEADLVQFTGGEDVSATFYGEHYHRTTSSKPARDEAEQDIYELALAIGIPMAGICRGAQLLNVMNGGKLWQDVDGHAIGGTHEAYIVGNLIPVQVSSTHHQMMRPNYSPEVECQVLMVAEKSKKRSHMTDLGASSSYEITSYRMGNSKDDIEAVYYGNSNCLCYQPHPEFGGPLYTECRSLYFQWINEFLFSDDEEAE